MLEVQNDKETIFNTDELKPDTLSNTTALLENNDDNESSKVSSILEAGSLDNDIPEPNCLALTVRKDYNLMIVKNIFTASGRLSWKIVLATVVLNFLNLLF